jgi:hypothetical protein
MSARTPILVHQSPGSAGRVLLARSELDVHWALNQREATAVRAAKPEIIEVIRKDTPEQTLLDLGRRAKIAFAELPRVPLEAMVEVTSGNGGHVVEAIDVGPSGVCVRGLPAAIGDRYDLKLLAREPSIEASAVVVRTTNERGEAIAGLKFNFISDADRLRMWKLVRDTREGTGPVRGRIPQFGTSDLPLRARLADDPAALYRKLVHDVLSSEDPDMTVPGWIARVARSLTAVERRAAIDPTQAPAWAAEALDARLSLARPENGSLDPTSAAATKAIELARKLSSATEDADESTILDVVQIRAALLRGVHGRASRDRIGTIEAARAIGEEWPSPREPIWP